MKKIIILSTITTAIIVLIASCNWFKPCEGRYIYEIVGYEAQLYEKNPPDIGGATLIDKDYSVINYSKIRLSIDCIIKLIGASKECSLMGPDSTTSSISNVDIFLNKDYNDSHSCNDNLNNFLIEPYFNIPILEAMKKHSYASIYASLPEAPSQADTFIFSVHIELTDNKIFDIESRPIIITP